jgi:hypothetical protein
LSFIFDNILLLSQIFPSAATDFSARRKFQRFCTPFRDTGRSLPEVLPHMASVAANTAIMLTYMPIYVLAILTKTAAPVRKAPGAPYLILKS